MSATALELALEGLDSATETARVRLEGMHRLIAMLGEHLEAATEILNPLRVMEQMLEGDVGYLVERRRIVEELVNRTGLHAAR